MRKINFHFLLLNSKVYKYVLAVFISQFLFFNLHAQSRQLDSLDQLIAKAKTDTDRINLNIKKINILSRSNLDTAIYLSAQQLKEAEKLNFYKGIIKLHSQLASSYTFKGNYDSAKENIQFLEKFIKPSDSLSFAGVYASYGMMYGVQANYDSSIKFYGKAIALNERLNNVHELPANYANVAIGYQQLANFSKALEYQQKALSLAETNKDEELRAKTLLNMANTYENIDDTIKAVQTYLKAKDIAVTHHYKIIELYVYTNLSTLYVRGNEWNKAYDLAIKAADLASTSGDVGIEAASLAKAATALANQNKFEEASRLSKQSILLADSSAQPLNISQAYESMGTILFLQKKYREAIPYYEKSFQALNGASNYDQAYVDSYKALSECYEKTGDYVKALANYKIAAGLADSIKRKDNIKKATELSMNYDFEKKQEVLAAEKKREDELARTKELVLIIGLLFVLILALVALKGYSNKQKANKLLTLQKQKIESTLQELKSTQSQLIQSEKMASLGELTAGIAHEIQNPLNFVNNFSEVNSELIDELKTELATGNTQQAIEIADGIKDNEQKIIHHGKRADAIVKGMLQHSRTSTGQKELTNINALCEECLRLSYHGLRAKDLRDSENKSFNPEFIKDLDDTIGKINIVQPDMVRVMLNLFNNAFYAVCEKKEQHPNYEPTVSISTKKMNARPDDIVGRDKVLITVKDNGPGIPQKIVDKIFQPFFTTKPTGEGTGLGLSLSYDIIKAHGGEIKVESKAGEGSEFIISLPF